MVVEACQETTHSPVHVSCKVKIVTPKLRIHTFKLICEFRCSQQVVSLSKSQNNDASLSKMYDVAANLVNVPSRPVATETLTIGPQRCDGLATPTA